MRKDIEKEINKIYSSVFNKVFKTVKKNNKNFNSDDVLKTILRLENSKKYKEFAEKFAKELAKKGLSKERGVWKKFYKIAKKKKHIILPSTYREFELQQFKKATYHNFNLIKSIPQDIMKIYKYKYIKTLISQVAEGRLGRGTFEQQLKSTGATRAKLIARTETAKLQTAISENRSTDLGSVCYIWRASNDMRTRQSHKEMNDVVVFWRKESEKPILDNMQGNAGEFPNCRCSPLPIFDEDDLKKSTYKLYNYKVHKVITVNKQVLLKYIKQKEIA